MAGVDKNACSSHRRKRCALVNVGRDRKSRGPAELHASFSAFEQLWRAHACIFHEQTDFNPRGMRSNYPPASLPSLLLSLPRSSFRQEPGEFRAWAWACLPEPELPRAGWPLSPPPPPPRFEKTWPGGERAGAELLTNFRLVKFSVFSLPFFLSYRASIRSLIIDR